MEKRNPSCYTDENIWISVLPEQYRSREEFEFVSRDPALPDVLLIGDSISMSYTVGVRSRLAGRANVLRAPNNCRSTSQILDELSIYLGAIDWSLIHFNAGIHDLTWIGDDGKATESGRGSRRVSLADYKANLLRIVDRLEAGGAKIVWASTTPVQPGTPSRDTDDVPRYNRCASEIMSRRGIPTDDLYTLVSGRERELQPPDNVHFTAHGAEVLADAVAAYIAAVLSI